MQIAKVLRVINGLVRGVGLGTLGFESLRNSIVGLRLNFTDTGGTARNLVLFIGLCGFELAGSRCALRPELAER